MIKNIDWGKLGTFLLGVVGVIILSLIFLIIILGCSLVIQTMWLTLMS